MIVVIHFAIVNVNELVDTLSVATLNVIVGIHFVTDVIGRVGSLSVATLDIITADGTDDNVRWSIVPAQHGGGASERSTLLALSNIQASCSCQKFQQTKRAHIRHRARATG